MWVIFYKNVFDAIIGSVTVLWQHYLIN